MEAPFTPRRISTEPLPRLELRAATPPSPSPPQCFPCSCRIATPYGGKTTCVTSFFSSSDFIPRGNFTSWLSLWKLISTNTLASFPARRRTSIPSGPEQIHSTARQSARDCLEVQTHSPPLVLRWKLPSSLRRNSHVVIPNGVCGVRIFLFLGFRQRELLALLGMACQTTLSAAYYGVTVSFFPLYFTVLSAASVRPPPTP